MFFEENKRKRCWNIVPWLVRIVAIAMLINISVQKCQDKNVVKQKAMVTNQKTR